LLDKFSNYWAKLASEFKTSKYILGFEIINEPFPGSDNLIRLLPWVADRTVLQPFYNRVQKSIREVDDERIIFFESVTWVFTIGAKLGFTEPPGGYTYSNRSVLSIHNSPINEEINKYYDSRISHSKLLETGIMVTETGDDSFNATD